MSLAELRKGCGYKTQKDFSSALGMKSTTVSMWESGKSVPRTHCLSHLARVLGVTVDVVVNCFNDKLQYKE